MEYGLIGYPLKHSFSKELHSLISNYTYELCELNENELDVFMKKKEFKGINVTIPYKQKVFPYLDYIDSEAKNINAVNTIINDNGKLKGYNTDVLGVLSTFSHYNIDANGKNVLILGTGATSNTVNAALKMLGASKIHKAYRDSSKVKGDVLYNEIDKLYDEIDIIVNTTSNGMFPHNGDSLLIDLSKFKNLNFVMDVVYNPLRTFLLQMADKLHIKTASGLYMLTAQAIYASFLFQHKSFDNIKIYDDLKKGKIDNQKSDIPLNTELNKKCDEIYKKVLYDKLNIVLTGMPTSGKSTIGKMISKKYGYEFIDIDELIEKEIKCKISDYINNNGEESFRNIESEVIKNIANKNHSVIATGGGTILREENITNLKYNGKIFYINKPLTELKPSSKRPLTSDIAKLKQKYTERLPIYKKTCDIEIDGTLPDEAEIENIMRNL